MARAAQAIHEECDYFTVDVSANITAVYDGPALLYGVCVNTVLSAQVLPLTDGSGGAAVVSLAASSAVGTYVKFPGIHFSTGLYVDPNDAATGSITVFYRPYNV